MTSTYDPRRTGTSRFDRRARSSSRREDVDRGVPSAPRIGPAVVAHGEGVLPGTELLVELLLQTRPGREVHSYGACVGLDWRWTASVSPGEAVPAWMAGTVGAWAIQIAPQRRIATTNLAINIRMFDNLVQDPHRSACVSDGCLRTTRWPLPHTAAGVPMMLGDTTTAPGSTSPARCQRRATTRGQSSTFDDTRPRNDDGRKRTAQARRHDRLRLGLAPTEPPPPEHCWTLMSEGCASSSIRQNPRHQT